MSITHAPAANTRITAPIQALRVAEARGPTLSQSRTTVRSPSVRMETRANVTTSSASPIASGASPATSVTSSPPRFRGTPRNAASLAATPRETSGAVSATRSSLTRIRSSAPPFPAPSSAIHTVACVRLRGQPEASQQPSSRSSISTRAARRTMPSPPR